MSVQVDALMEHSLTREQLNRLQDELNSLTPQLHPNSGLQWEWSLDQENPLPSDELAQYSEVSIYLPGHFSVHIRTRLLTIGHVARWSRFLTDPKTQSQVRTDIRSLAAVFQARRLIYVPDSGFDASFASELDLPTLDLVEQQLNERVGPPSDTLSSIYQVNPDGCWSGNGYFIERLGLA